MKFVYILESLDSEHFYVGIADDPETRLTKHNAGEVTHTRTYKPWRIKTYIAFSEENGRSPLRNTSNPAQAGHLRTSVSDA